MRFGRPRIPEEASFDLTPLIDVVLLLIIFFMLTAQFARTQVSALDLPREKGKTIDKAGHSSMIIELRRDGTLSVLQKPVDMAALLSLVESEVIKSGPDLDLVVRAERTCPAVHLNRLADALAQAGVRNWKLATAGAVGGGS